MAPRGSEERPRPRGAAEGAEREREGGRGGAAGAMGAGEARGKRAGGAPGPGAGPKRARLGLLAKAASEAGGPEGVLVARRVREPAPGEETSEWFSKRERYTFLLHALERAQQKLEADILVQAGSSSAPTMQPKHEEVASRESQAKVAEVDEQAREREDREEQLRKVGSFQLRLHQMKKLQQVRTMIGELRRRLDNKALEVVRPATCQLARPVSAIVAAISRETSLGDGAPGTPEPPENRTQTAP